MQLAFNLKFYLWGSAPRVEPTATSHTFMVHGEACARSAANPTCTHDKEGQIPAGKLYVVDVKAVMGTDWVVCMHHRIIITESDERMAFEMSCVITVPAVWCGRVLKGNCICRILLARFCWQDRQELGT